MTGKCNDAPCQLEEAMAVIDTLCKTVVWMTSARDFGQGGRMRKEYRDRYELAHIQGQLFLNKNNYGSNK